MKKIKSFIAKIRNFIQLKKEIKSQLELLTVYIPCFNLSVKYNMRKGFVFYNNSDLIAAFTYCETKEIFLLGKPFFDLLIYCLCIKNSIDNY